jgi:hypothetical protein
MSRPRFPRDEETTPIEVPVPSRRFHDGPCPKDPRLPAEFRPSRRTTLRATMGRVARHPASWATAAVLLLEILREALPLLIPLLTKH